MGCATCTNKGEGIPTGCKSNGSCSSGGCNKLTVFNWLSNMALPANVTPFNCIEVRFKNGRKEFYRNIDDLSLSIGDLVVVKAERGYDLGHVTLKGGLIQVQMKKKKVDPKKDLLAIVRKATQKDIDLWTQSREKEDYDKNAQTSIIENYILCSGVYKTKKDILLDVTRYCNDFYKFNGQPKAHGEYKDNDQDEMWSLGEELHSHDGHPLNNK